MPFTTTVSPANDVPMAELQRRLMVMARDGHDPRAHVERTIDTGALSERIGYQLLHALTNYR
jgi:hypothetical protein